MQAVQQTEILIIGGGYSGVGAAIKLKEAGINDFLLIEKAAKLGGTWRENTYPMAGADTPSILYSFSFRRNPDWDYTFALQPQIERYIDETADAFGLPAHVQFDTEAEIGEWDEAAARWVVKTNHGTIHAKYVIACAGPMHEAALPDIPGVASFAGEAFHTARWNHDVDLSGKRVAVIGTGASAIQYVPVIQPEVKELILFQRTAPWVLPRLNKRATKLKKAIYRRIPWINQRVADVIYAGSEALQLLQRNPRRMKLLQRISLIHLKRQVADRELRAQLTPHFAMGCKRMLFSNAWYPALAAANTTVVSEGVQAIESDGLVSTSGRKLEADVIIYSTGFRVTDPDIARRVRGRNGRLLADLWQGTPQAYQTTAVHGYPNAFVMLGPNVGNGHGSATTLIELLGDYIVKAINETERRGAASIEVRLPVQQRWNARVQAALAGTVWNDGGCSSYYIDDNGVNSAIYPWTTVQFRRETSHLSPDDYEFRPAGRPTDDASNKETVTA